MKFVCKSCSREFDIGAPKGMQLPCPACGGMLGDAEDGAPASPAPAAAPSPAKAAPFDAPAEDSAEEEFSLDAAERFAAGGASDEVEAAAPAPPAAVPAAEPPAPAPPAPAAAPAPPDPVPAAAPPAPVPAAEEYAEPEAEAVAESGEAAHEEGYEEEGFAVEGEEELAGGGLAEKGVPEEGAPEEELLEEEEEAAHPMVLMLGWVLFGVAFVGLMVMGYFLKEYRTRIESSIGSVDVRTKMHKLQKDLDDQASVLLSYKKDRDQETERADGMAKELKALRPKAAEHETRSREAEASAKHLEAELASATQALEEASRERDRLRRLSVKWEAEATHSSARAKGAALALRAAGYLDRPALWGEALGLLDAATRANDDLAAAWLLKGEILVRVGRPKQAIGAFNKVDQIARNSEAEGHARALVAAGDVCRVQLGEDRRAAAYYHRAAEAAPGSPYGRLGEIRELILADNEVAALEKIEEGIKAVEENGADATPLRAAYAELLAVDEGSRAEAIAAASEVIAANPVLVSVLDLRARLLTRDERPEAALRDFARAAELDPSNGGRLVALGKMLLGLKRPAEAEPFLLRAVELLSESVEALNALGRALLDLNRHEEAEARLTEVMRLDADNVEARRLRGEARVELGRVRDGISDLEASLRHSENVRARIVLARTYTHSRVPRYRIPVKAIEHALVAVELTNSDDAEALSALAQAYAARGDLSRAALEMRKAIKLDPDNDSYKVLLGEFGKKTRR